jgi:hypothetical protein
LIKNKEEYNVIFFNERKNIEQKIERLERIEETILWGLKAKIKKILEKLPFLKKRKRN